MKIDRLAVSYHEGWDPTARTVVGALSTAVARERDRAGEQYAVLLSFDDRPLLLIEIAWASHYCSIWLIDEEGRRHVHIDTRLLDGTHIVTQEIRSWTYSDAGQPEFDNHAARKRWEIRQDGYLQIWDEPGGDKGGCRGTGHKIDPEQYRTKAPEFGSWHVFDDCLRIVGRQIADDVLFTDVSVDESEELPPGERPWHPPRPLRPQGLDKIFTQGTRYRIEHVGEVSMTVERIGRQHLPSGKVAAADPAWLHFGAEPFTATVPPADYDLVLAWAQFTDNPGHRRVAAAKLVITDGPVTDWELALRPGEDPRTLGEGQFFGFGVDSGTACFVDAAAIEPLARVFEETCEARWEDDPETPEFTDPETGANLIAFPAGWGDGAYPTWIGRARDGAIACLVADMLVVHRSTPMQ